MADRRPEDSGTARRPGRPDPADQQGVRLLRPGPQDRPTGGGDAAAGSGAASKPSGKERFAAVLAGSDSREGKSGGPKGRRSGSARRTCG